MMSDTTLENDLAVYLLRPRNLLLDIYPTEMCLLLHCLRMFFDNNPKLDSSQMLTMVESINCDLYTYGYHKVMKANEPQVYTQIGKKLTNIE